MKNEGRLGSDDLADQVRVAVDELGPVGSLVGGGVAEVVRKFVQEHFCGHAGCYGGAVHIREPRVLWVIDG